MGRISAAPGPDGPHTQEVLDWLLRNGRREKLCGEVAAISGASRDLVEDALQEVCERAATTSKCRGTSEGEVYKWLLTATLRRVSKLRRRAYRRYEVLVDWRDAGDSEPPRGSDGADVEVLERERERELGELARTVVDGLDERQRQVAALHSRRVSGAEIARHLGTSERRVKHLKAETYVRARDTLVKAAGGGCQEGERLISRFCFGLASSGERTAAQLHLPSCERCAALYRRLELMHDKIAALLPIPAAAQADPGLVERAFERAAEALAHAKQQLADAGSQAKQHAAASYTRAVEYTPIASVRPGAAATAVAGCLAVGGGAAGYCIDRGVDPITSLVDVVQAAPAKPAQEPAKQSAPAQQRSEPPQLATPTPPPPAAPEPTPPQPTPAAPQQPAPPPEPPPQPTPAPVQFGEPATATQAAPSEPSPPAEPTEPAPVPQSGGTDLYGP